MFFFLNFLAATQDIAVDGWALTMLQRHNVGYASTCNTVGQTAGYFLVSKKLDILEKFLPKICHLGLRFLHFSRELQSFNFVRLFELLGCGVFDSNNTCCNFQTGIQNKRSMFRIFFIFHPFISIFF